MSQVLVVGSIGFDIIFDIHGRIEDELIIKQGRLDTINMMFTAKDKKHFFGGTGGNIAYGLGVLGDNPFLFSLAGKDFSQDYAKHLSKVGVNCKVKINKSDWSASFYSMSDEKRQQIGVWQPNSYSLIEKTILSSTLKPNEMKEIKIAIFSAGTGKSILNHITEFRKHNHSATIIFDPGQILSIMYDRALLEKTINLSDIFIGNETEIKQLKFLLKYSIQDLLRKGIKFVIETKGEKGSIVYTSKGKKFIKPFIPKHIIETTGAGDAYRAGLIHGLLKGLKIAKACEFGSMVAAKSLEFSGGQEYRINLTSQERE